MKLETGATPVLRSPLLALVALVPLVWLLAVTFTAGAEKIFSHNPRIGFLQAADDWNSNLGPLFEAENMAAYNHDESAMVAAHKAVVEGRRQQFNSRLDAAMTLIFLALVAAIVSLSIREWTLLLARRKPAVLRETAPVWLPDYALKESGPNLRTAAGAAAIALGLAKELSGETHFERARQQTCICEQHSEQKIFAQVTEARFNGVRRCC